MQEAKSQIATGIVESAQPLSGPVEIGSLETIPSEMDLSEGTVAPELMDPSLSSVPSFAGELNATFLSEELIQKMDNEYSRQLEAVTRNQGFYAMSFDSRRGSTLNKGVESKEELSKKMADSVRNYVVLRGLPKFLSTREQTKELGKAYAQTIQAVTEAATIQVKTKNNWALGSGINPLGMKAWAKASNKNWNMEAVQDLRSSVTTVSSWRSFSTFNAGTTFNVNESILSPSIQTQLAPQWTAGLATHVPIARKLETRATIDLQAQF